MTFIIIGIGVVILTLIAIITGIRGYDSYEMGIDLVVPGSTTFEVGITNRHYDTANGDIEQELRIGLFFIIFFIVFFRNDA
jgi:hypothetical protein